MGIRSTVCGFIAVFQTVLLMYACCRTVLAAIRRRTEFNTIGVMRTLSRACAKLRGTFAFVNTIRLVVHRKALIDFSCTDTQCQTGNLMFLILHHRAVGITCTKHGTAFHMLLGFAVAFPILAGTDNGSAAQQNNRPLLLCRSFCSQQIDKPSLLSIGCGQQKSAFFIHTGNNSVTGSSQHFRFIHPEQVLQQRLIFAVQCGIVIQVAAELGIRQRKQDAAFRNGGAFSCLHRLNGTTVTGGIPGVVNIQFAAADCLTGLRGNFCLFAHRIALILHGNHQLTGKVGFHTSGNFFAAFQFYQNRIAGTQIRLLLQIHCHSAIQTQHSQRTLFQHYFRHAVAHLGMDLLDLAAGSSADPGIQGIIFGIVDLLLDIVHGAADFHNGVHNGHPVHFGNGSSLFHNIPVTNQKFRNFHTAGNGYIHGIAGNQRAAAFKNGFQISLSCRSCENTGTGTGFFFLLFCQQRHHCQKYHHSKRQNPDNISFHPFFVHGLSSVVQGIDGLHLGSFIGGIQSENHTDQEAENNRCQHNTAVQLEHKSGAGNHCGDHLQNRPA